MDAQIALLLAQDGLVNGAVYGLMAVALVLVFSVTRIIFIPQPPPRCSSPRTTWLRAPST